MANAKQSRYKGKFCKANILQWKNNLHNKSTKCNEEIEDVNQTFPVLGNRVVNIYLLAKSLRCHSCEMVLSLENIVKETIYGLASVFHVKCLGCNLIFEINTSNKEKNNTAPTYTVNSKIITGIITSGAGQTHLNKILCYGDIPTVHSSLFKRYERRVGRKIESIAENSCLQNIKLERELTIQREGLRFLFDWSEDNLVDLTISYDAGWQKRGSSRSYNSSTGHGTAIGFYSGKVVGYATRNKRCCSCEKSKAKPNHDCRKNYSGSSKSMEADMAVEIFLRNPHFSEVKVRLGTLIGDDDSSTICRLRSEAEHAINKWSDINHATSKLSKCLYALKLSTPIIKYFKYCFGCVIKTNKNNTQATKEGLLNIVPHAYNDHRKCGDWCDYKKDRENYKHKILPKGEGLSGDTKKEQLISIFTSFANNADKLSPCGSSQANESLNMTIASVAPKSLHYGGSSSNDIRVAAAIIQKNDGHVGIEEINNQLENSPTSKKSHNYLVEQDIKKNKRKIKAQTTVFKQRRRQLFKKKLNTNNAAAQKEGISYQSGAGFDLGIEFIDQSSALKSSNVSMLSAKTVVFFDLETTGFHKSKEIIQIAAKFGDMEFNTYILPNGNVSEQASEVTKLTKVKNTLLLNSIPVTTVSKSAAILDFLAFLRNIGEGIVLTAHNCFRFDAPTLLNFVVNENVVQEFKSIVYGFADTLMIFKEKLKGQNPNTPQEKIIYKQEELAKKFLHLDENIHAHNAIYDVSILEKLTRHESINVSDKNILESAMSLTTFINKKATKKKNDDLKSSFHILLQDKNKTEGISKSMITKIVNAGINIEQLRECYKNRGPKGITILLSQDIGGRPRVTKSKKIIKNLCTQLTKMFP